MDWTAAEYVWIQTVIWDTTPVTVRGPLSAVRVTGTPPPTALSANLLKDAVSDMKYTTVHAVGP